jgi:hypothetical protein
VTLTNNTGGSLAQGNVVTFTSAGGILSKAVATDSTLPDAEIGIVQDTSIASGASGNVIVRRGAIAGGFSSLTAGKMYWVDVTAGAVVDSLGGFVAGNQIYEVGRAYSATEVMYDPKFVMEF